MVTEATSSTETETTPNAEAPTPVAVEDGPLIPPETGSEATLADEQGPDAKEKGAAEAKEGEAAVEGDVKTRTAETAEKQAETKTEEKAEAETPRTFTVEEHDAELAKVRSGLDKRISDIETERTTERQQVAAQVTAMQQQALQRDVASFQAGLQQQFTNQGLSDQDALTAAQQVAESTRAAFEHSERANRAEAALKTANDSRESTAKDVLIRDAVNQFDVPEDKVHFLATATTAEQITDLAKEFSSHQKTTAELSAVKQKEVPAGGPEQQIDSGAGGTSLTDDQKIADVTTDLAEVGRILASRGLHPFR